VGLHSGLMISGQSRHWFEISATPAPPS